jgi:serine/threonine protein phosphatase PrpC
MVCDAFADFAPSSSFEDTIEGARVRMQEVNDQLLFTSTRSLLADRSGSTVVALFVRGHRLAVLWAGDSRAYRLRAGRLEQLSQDHSPSESGGLSGILNTNAVTRAVGAQSTLDLDLHRDDVRSGDRYLLCSDGLTRAVPAPHIKALLEGPDIQAAVDGLIKATLDAGAPDNVTAIVVEACSDTP